MNVPWPRGPLEAVLFDLDGTLLDSVELIRASWRHCLEAHGLSVEPGRLAAGMGRPLLTQMRELVGDEARARRMVDTYRAWNHEHHDRYVRAFPGVVEALAGLERAGLELAVVTSKGREGALRGLDSLGLGRLASRLVSADDVTRHKPEPDPVLAGLELVGRAAGRAVYVGDAPVDLRAGRAAGTGVVAVTWGAFERGPLEAEGPDLVLERPAELLGLAQADLL